MSAIAVDCWRIPLGIVESGRTSCVARRGRAPARCSTFIIIFYEASNKLAVGEKGWAEARAAAGSSLRSLPRSSFDETSYLI